MERRPAVRRIATGWRGWLCLFLVVVAPSSGRGSTLVAPHALYMGDDSRSAVLYLQNVGDRTEEVSIELQFGYPVSDSTGNVHVELIEDLVRDDPLLTIPHPRMTERAFVVLPLLEIDPDPLLPDGMHVLVPIERRSTYAQTREFCEIVAGRAVSTTSMISASGTS